MNSEKMKKKIINEKMMNKHVNQCISYISALNRQCWNKNNEPIKATNETVNGIT